jgi:hypothetical protein
MKKILFIFAIVLFGVSACSTHQNVPTQKSPKATTVIAYPQDEPTIIPTATMTEQEIFYACAETITKFMQSNPCKDWDAYHALLSTKSPRYKATPMAENDPACEMKESVKILQILTVEEWWQMGHNGEDLPGDLHPIQPGERVFFVKTETTWRPHPGVVPPSTDSTIMRLLPENGKCLMRTFGWG